ncbi:helix-turn-helix domain-containing protein [Nocardia sp. NPDC050710]|uniref:PucR family transcriptional regulator n=1 Tax=Nocardia sp. NPDC050710 TaxID=3157220 RepID=UPI0033C53903
MSVALPPLPGDAPIIARLLRRLPDIAERMLAAGLGATPPAADLPDGHFTDEVLPAIYACGWAFLRALEEQRPFTSAEVAEFVGPVAERHAEDRIPLGVLMDAVHGSAQQILREVAALAEPEDMDDLVAFGSRLLDLLRHINIAVVEAYTEVEQSIYNAEREARRALCSALLRGQPAEELAARADMALEDRYTVLATHIRPEGQPAAVADLVTRRRIRILQRALDAMAGTTALSTFDGSTGIALLPAGGEGSGPEAARLDRLATELAAQFGVDVFVAERRAIARERLPDAVQEATDLAELARLLGRPTGRYGLDELLLEYQLTRPGPARDRLSERIFPLLRHPHLFEALDAHLRHGSDRKAAAAEVHVHPNTFSYRLRRIAELTGIDPSEPTGSRLLAAALTVYRFYPTAESAQPVEPE